LHGVDDKVRAIWGADSVVVREHMTCKFFSEGVCNMAGNEATDGGGDSEGS